MASISMAPSQRMYTNNTVQNDASSSMMPQGLDGNVVFSKASTPAIVTKQLNPSHVFINNSGSFYFKYESTAAIGASDTGGYTLGMVVKGGANNAVTPIRLDIQPCAWSGSSDGVTGGALNTGDVTFIYRGQ